MKRNCIPKPQSQLTGIFASIGEAYFIYLFLRLCISLFTNSCVSIHLETCDMLEGDLDVFPSCCYILICAKFPWHHWKKVNDSKYVPANLILAHS